MLPAEFAGRRRLSKLEFWGKLLASSGSSDKMDGRVHVLWSWLSSKISSSSIWKQPGKTQPIYFMFIHRLAHNICIVSQWTAICKLVFVGVFVRVLYPVPDAFIWPLDMRSGLFKNYFKMSIYLSNSSYAFVCMNNFHTSTELSSITQGDGLLL